MVYELTKFYCEECNKSFECEDNAQKCEDSHK